MTEMLDELFEAKAILDGERDIFCEALALLAAKGHATIVPRSDALISKPVIMVPERLYARMLELYGEKAKEGE